MDKTFGPWSVYEKMTQNLATAASNELTQLEEVH